MTLNRNKTYAVITIVSILAAVVMQLRQEYIFYAKEAEHLWLNDWMWLRPQLVSPGGAVQLFTSLITQFYAFWGMGALTLSIVMAYVFMTGWRICRSFKINDVVASLWILPIGFMILCNEHSYFNLRFHFAFLFSLLTAYLYIKLTKYWSPLWLSFASAAITAATYWLAGSAAVVTAAVIVLFEVFRNRHWFSAALSLLAVAAMGVVSARARFIVGWEEAFTPAQYYEWPSTYFFPLYAWLSVPAIFLVGRMFGMEIIAKRLSAKSETTLFALFSLISCLLLFRIYTLVHNPNAYLLRRDEWNARQEDWDEIIASHRGLKQPTAFISYLNLALAEKGQLVEKMGQFNPYIILTDEGNLAPVLMQNHELSRDALKLQSCVFMRWGGAALANAQKSAFEANLLTPGETDPVELRRLVVTNTLFSTPLAAEKYRRRLARTTFHSDSIHIPHSAALPAEDGFYFKTQVGRMLRQIAMQTPENHVAAQFYEAYLIQSQDTTAYRHWKEFLGKNKK